MTRKFNSDRCMEVFTKHLNEAFRNRLPISIISLTYIAIWTCRELKYAQWKNRDAMNELIRKWWGELPNAIEEPYEKNLFGIDCYITTAWGPRFIYIKKFYGIQSGELINFKPSYTWTDKEKGALEAKEEDRIIVCER